MNSLDRLKLVGMAISVCLVFGASVFLISGTGLALNLPQGRLLFYMNGHLYTLNADGTDLHKLPRGTGIDAPMASWSPGGQQILFQGKYDENRSIFLINADGTEFRDLTQGLFGASPKWSPDGKRILYLRPSNEAYAWRIFVMNRDGSNQVPIGDRLTSNSYVSWSPDGQWVTFSSDNASGETSQIYRQAVDEDELIQLTDMDCENHIPKWSPDGQHIAFSHNCPSQEDDAVYIMDPDGSNPVRLTTPPQTRAFSYRWSPDSRYIAYLGQDEIGYGWLYVVRPDGSGLTQIGWDAQLDDPIRVLDFAWSPVSDYIALSGTPSSAPCEIYLTDVSCLSSPVDCRDVPATDLTGRYDRDITECPMYLDWGVTAAISTTQ